MTAAQIGRTDVEVWESSELKSAAQFIMQDLAPLALNVFMLT
jgi:hypothetical protein